MRLLILSLLIALSGCTLESVTFLSDGGTTYESEPECEVAKDPSLRFEMWDVWTCFDREGCSIWCRKPFGSPAACFPGQYANMQCGCVQDEGYTGAGGCARVFRENGYPQWKEHPADIYDGGIHWPPKAWQSGGEK